MTEALARYETAQETLGMLAAMRTRWIYEEEQKDTPDVGKIAQWKKEQAYFSDEDDALLFTDSGEIERVITVYGPMVKATLPRHERPLQAIQR
jgi:hypothetical protein